MARAIIAAAALLVAAPALAQQATPPDAGMQQPPPGGPGGPDGGPEGMMRGGAGMLRMADRNGDGIVTREEYLAAVDARFAREDRNGDGVLTPDEMPLRGPMRGPGGDTPPPPPANGDSPTATGTPPAPPPPPSGARGPITRARYREMAMRRFDRWDTNHDGRIDQGEMATAAQMGPRGPGRRGGGSQMPMPPADQ